MTLEHKYIVYLKKKWYDYLRKGTGYMINIMNNILLAATETATSEVVTEAAGSEPKVSIWFYIPVIILFFILLASPAIQLVLSTKKKWYIGLIYPLFTFIVFGVAMLIVPTHKTAMGAITILSPLCLIAFHIIIRKNMRY